MCYWNRHLNGPICEEFFFPSKLMENNQDGERRSAMCVGFNGFRIETKWVILCRRSAFGVTSTI